MALSGHFLYQPLPDREQRQLSPAWFEARRGVVTASTVAALAGFFEPAASKVLGGFSDPKAACNALDQLRSSAIPARADTVPMQWGRLHESNPLMTLLEPTQRKGIREVGDFSLVKLQECTFIRVDVSKLPPSITAGLTALQLSNLPLMGASPDAMLLGYRDARGAAPATEITMPVECKAPCPFKPNTGPGDQAATWTYVESPLREWDVIPAHYYAQCQMTMLATGSDRMLLMVYSPLTTSAFMVLRHDVWAQRLLVWLSLFNLTKIKSASPQVVQLLGEQLKTANTALIQESRAECRKFELLGRVDSSNSSDMVDARFLDDS